MDLKCQVILTQERLQNLSKVTILVRKNSYLSMTNPRPLFYAQRHTKFPNNLKIILVFALCVFHLPVQVQYSSLIFVT